MQHQQIQFFWYALLLYGALVFGVGLLSSRLSGRTIFKDFVTAGSHQPAPWIALSLMATMLGSSNTFGSMELYRHIGFPAFWWMFVGVIGLAAQALLLSKPIRAMNANTLAHVARLTLGETAGRCIGVCVAISWVGVVAAQFAALGNLLSVVVLAPKMWLCLLALIIIIHTAIGGQSSVIRIDALQSMLILLGFTLAAYFLLTSGSVTPCLWMEMASPFNSAFGIGDLAHLIVIVGGSYFIGPDLFARNLTAKDGPTACKATLTAAVLLAILTLLMSWIGVWASTCQNGTQSPLTQLILTLPLPAKLLLTTGLVAALASSADTALLSDASVIENDILRGQSIIRTRVLVVCIGLAALSMALWQRAIISIFLTAYGIYVPSTVVPLSVAILTHTRRKLHGGLSLAGIATGGVCGLAGPLLGCFWLPMVGIGMSALWMLGAYHYGQPVSPPLERTKSSNISPIQKYPRHA